MSTRYATLFARLVANSTTDTDLGCWRWTGRHTSNGRPRLNVWRDGKHTTVIAYRAMEQHLRHLRAQFAADDAMPGLLLAPDVPEPAIDETLDHSCACINCINPDHWQEVPNAENARRQQAAAPSGWWARRAA